MHTRGNSISLLLVHVGSCVLLLTLGACAVSVNNINVFQPIVRTSPDTGNPSDQFGFAAIMHQMEVVATDDNLEDATRKTRIIVGAPRGTFPGGTGLPDPGTPRAEETGLVYTCPVQPGICQGVRGDTERYLNVSDAQENNGELAGRVVTDYPQPWIEGRLFDQAPNARLFFRDDGSYVPAENKTGQLLGATLFSNGETFMACAPRWTDTRLVSSNLFPRGICYTSGRNLEGFERLQPCDSVTPTAGNTNGDGYCLAGTSALVYDGGFVIGAPGNNVSLGSLFYSVRSAPASFESGLSYLTKMDGEVITDQYQGFSTVTAFITRERDSNPPPNIVAAVPRFDDDTYSGRITVYNPPDNSSANLTATHTAYNTIQNVEARGTQMAEFFGHSMIAIDINGDNYDDLVIGAPMNTEFDALKIERGRVYVFMNTGSGQLDSNNPIIFNGPNPRGRFGTSLANLGDIDQDGNEDFVVGAPYTENGTNTGAVYIYYGNTDWTAFESQTPFEITASDVVNNVSSISELRTFGYSVSGGIDVDNNKFNDLLVGAYESQLVVLFRSLPVVTVTVGMEVVGSTPVPLDSMFTVRVTARYDGVGMNGQIVVPVTLSEDRSATVASRLKFDNDGAVNITLRGPGMMNSQTIVITSLGNTTSLDDHMLQLTIPGGIDPPMTVTDGNQSLVDLSRYPRLRLAGNNVLAVPVTDPCGGDGCQFDVSLASSIETIEVIANDNPISTLELTYENVNAPDIEDAVGLQLEFSGLSRYIRSVAIQREGATPAETPCKAITNGMANCTLRTRFAPGNRETVAVNFTIDQDSLTGSEDDFTVTLNVVSRTGNDSDEDVNINNNAVMVTFDIVARADISVTRLSFGGERFDYTAIAPPMPVTIQNLGRSTITLEVDILNKGPTTIREGEITIYLPNRILDNNYTLYLFRIEGVNQNGVINCNTTFEDPDRLRQNTAGQVGEGRRRRRSAFQSSSLKRVARQENTVQRSCIGPVVDSGVCTTIRCRATNLRQGTVPFTISLFTRIDERYFSRQPVPGTVYSLTTSANVSIMSSFYGDNTNDNFEQVTIQLAPMIVVTPGTTDSNLLLHYILWPCIGGVLLLIAAAILLYFVGFFRRKKKPEEGEAEGDFDVNQYKLKGASDGGKEPSAPVGAEEVDPSAETSKV